MPLVKNNLHWLDLPSQIEQYVNHVVGLAEFEALEQTEKRTIRLHLSELGEKGLKQFADVVIQAVAQIGKVTQAMRD